MRTLAASVIVRASSERRSSSSASSAGGTCVASVCTLRGPVRLYLAYGHCFGQVLHGCDHSDMQRRPHGKSLICRALPVRVG